MSQIFEGSEKKLEIVMKAEAPSLRSWPEEEWLKVVELSGAKVLSKISNEHCNAYLLSESSLFVWDDFMVLITCGTTTLAKAAEHLAKKIPENQREAFFFQRKNEYFPHLQKSHFYDDIENLKATLPGEAFRLGHADEHHMFLYHSVGKMSPEMMGNTLEVLMYDLQGPAKEAFQKENSSVFEIREKTGIDKVLPGFEVDDHCFQPTGYSLNAIKDQYYYTIHVTPQDETPYVSFETNYADPEKAQNSLNAILEAVRPRSFDIVYFDTLEDAGIREVSGYTVRSRVRHEFDGGVKLHFAHYTDGTAIEHPATPIRS